MPTTLRILISSLITLGIIGLIEWGAWRNMGRMWSEHARFSAIRWGWFSVTALQFLWTLVYFWKWPHWREFQPQYLLVTHAVLISLMVPKLVLCGVEMVDGLRYWSQWLFTAKSSRADVPPKDLHHPDGPSCCGTLVRGFCPRDDPRPKRVPCPAT